MWFASEGIRIFYLLFGTYIPFHCGKYLAFSQLPLDRRQLSPIMQDGRQKPLVKNEVKISIIYLMRNYT